ncbi:TonB-dependent receptor [bacterium]|nr:TonB-dependent receptor [bacterium]
MNTRIASAFLRIPAFIALLLAVSTGLVYAQPSGEVHGTLTDVKTNEPIAGANILLLGTERGTATDLDGNYQLANVPPGVYAIQFSAVGYAQVVKTDISISSARPAKLDVQLEPTAVELETVTFTPGFFSSRDENQISTVVQGNEEIRRLPGGFEDVVRAISILPGIAQVSPGRNDLIVRGGAPSENLFIVDGFPIPNINHYGSQGATGGPQSFINLDFIEETTFSTGGFGVEYGDKLSSVLRVDLREGRDDRLGGKATVSASQFGLNLEGPIEGDRGSFIFSARRSYLDFIFKAAGFAFVPEYWDFLARTDYQLTERDRITVLGIAALDNVVLLNDEADQRYDNSRVPESDQILSLGGLKWQHVFNWGYSTVGLSHSLQDFQITQRDTLLSTVFSNDSREQETTVTGEVVVDLDDDTRLTTGVQQTFAAVDVNVDLPDYDDTYGGSLDLDRAYQQSSFKSAAYAEIERRFGLLRLTGGVRADYFDLLDDGFAFSPRLSALYPLSTRSNLTLSAGRYHQAPSYIWLSEPANTQLEQIGADQLVAGVDYLLRSDVKVSVEGFYKDYFNYPTSLDRPWLVLASTGAGYSGTQDGFASYGFDRLVSAGEGWSRGVELFAQKRAGDNPHYAIASLTWSETYFTALDGIERPSSFDQRWLFNIGGGFIFSNNWEASFKFRLATGSPYTPFEPDGSQDPAKFNTERTGINHSLDVRVDRRWFFDSWTLIAYVDVQNVYQNPYERAPRWDERENRAIVDESIGLLPTIGVSAEF